MLCNFSPYNNELQGEKYVTPNVIQVALCLMECAQECLTSALVRFPLLKLKTKMELEYKLAQEIHTC